VIERFDAPVPGGSLAMYRLAEQSSQAGEMVLAVHGITANSHAWPAVARALVPDVALLALDLRGRGASSELPGPYGIPIHASDVLAAIDHLELERAVLVGHSLGAYISARVAAEHPDRVRAVVLVDGGLTAPVPPDLDPQALLEALLGPALARLKLAFPSLDAYIEWWRRHPAFAAGDVSDADLAAYAQHDLVGEQPALRSGVSEEAVRADAEGVLEMGAFAHQLKVPARLLCAPRGLQNEPNPMQPLELVERWAAQAPGLRRFGQVPDVNHYSLVMGARGAAAVAGAVRGALSETGATA
jgi:pimeloyl-ACP methyl ester carboxylesterase